MLLNGRVKFQVLPTSLPQPTMSSSSQSTNPQRYYTERIVNIYLCTLKASDPDVRTIQPAYSVFACQCFRQKR